MKKTVAIIGAGIGGLVAGYELSKKGYKIDIYEKENEVGGLLADFEMSGQRLEKTYHHIFKTDKEIIGLIEELGLGNKLKWFKSSIALYYNNKFYPFLGSIDLLKFDELGLVDKFRLGAVYLWLKFDNNWQRYEKVTAAKWMKKWAGKRAYEVIWKPLLKGKFHQYYKEVSMAWLWARIHTRGGSTNEKGEEVLGYMDGGFGQITEKLIREIGKNGGKIKLGHEVNKLDFIKDYDLVIDTRPAKNVDYLGAINLVFSSKQSLSDYYWHNINDLDSPFLVMVQHTNLVGKKDYKNKNIYYLGTYLPKDHKFFESKDEEVEEEFFNYVKKIKPDFDPSQIGEKKVFRMRHAQQVVKRGYKPPEYKVGKKVWQLNFAQIYPEDRGINFAVKEVKKLIGMIENDN